MSVHGFPHQVIGDRSADQRPGLQRSVPEGVDGGNVGVPERQAPIRQVVLLAEVPDDRRHTPKVAPGHPGKQMVLQLKLQPPVEPIHPRGALNVDGALGLRVEPVVGRGRTHVDIGREMVEAELEVLDGRHRHAHQHEGHPLCPGGEAGDEEREPGPEDQDPQYVEGSIWDMPGGG